MVSDFFVVAERILRSARSIFAFAIASASTFIHGANSTPLAERMLLMTFLAPALISAWTCSDWYSSSVIA